MSKMICRNGQFDLIFFGALKFGIEGKNLLHEEEIGVQHEQAK
jgi:hypothetical protein